MQKYQCLLFVLKQSYICYYIICITVPLSIRRFLKTANGISVKLLELFKNCILKITSNIRVPVSLLSYYE